MKLSHIQHPYPNPSPGSEDQKDGGGEWYLCVVSDTAQWTRSFFVVSPRPISTSHLHALLRFQFWPINPVVCRGPYPLEGVRNLILEQASRLDAFSGYPFRT